MKFRRHVPEGFDWPVLRGHAAAAGRWLLRVPRQAAAGILRLPRGRRALLWMVGAPAAFLVGYLAAAVVLFPAPIFAATTMVPRILDMPQPSAADAIHALNLRVGDVDTMPHPVAARGDVVWQDPPPGVGLPEGAEVHFTVSGGPQRVPVPDLVGYEDLLAERLITAAGLRIRDVDSTQAPAPRGVVVATRPPAGRPLNPGGEITLVVSVGAPTIRVPDLMGMTREEAQAALETVGLLLGPTVRRRSSAGPPGTVMAQAPEPGTLSAPGAAVGVTLVREQNP